MIRCGPADGGIPRRSQAESGDGDTTASDGALAGAPFAIFAVLMVGQLIWVLLVMPETKGVPLEKMRDRLNLPAERRAATTA